jgi:DnaK suppressor protein
MHRTTPGPRIETNDCITSGEVRLRPCTWAGKPTGPISTRRNDWGIGSASYRFEQTMTLPLPESDTASARQRIAAERAEATHRVDFLTARLAEIIEGSHLTTDDDEHDPEGSTVAFERAQTASLLAEARRDLDELDAAEHRLDAGTYGLCEKCGRPISDERLDALPAARRCIHCA